MKGTISVLPFPHFLGFASKFLTFTPLPPPHTHDIWKTICFCGSITTVRTHNKYKSMIHVWFILPLTNWAEDTAADTAASTRNARQRPHVLHCMSLRTYDDAVAAARIHVRSAGGVRSRHFTVFEKRKNSERHRRERPFRTAFITIIITIIEALTV